MEICLRILFNFMLINIQPHLRKIEVYKLSSMKKFFNHRIYNILTDNVNKLQN